MIVSRRHALITHDGEQYGVVGLGATNGTYVRACVPRSAGGPMRVNGPRARVPDSCRRAQTRSGAAVLLHVARAVPPRCGALGRVCSERARHSRRSPNEAACVQVNAQQLRRDGFCPLRAGDVVSFGGPADVWRSGIRLSNPYRFRFEVPPTPTAAPRTAHEDTGGEPPARRRRTEAGAVAVPAQPLPSAPPGRVTRSAAAAAAAAAASAAAAEAAGVPPKSAAAAPLPTFEPRSVAPLKANTFADVVARLVADNTCPICYELVVAPHTLPACSHTFCGECATVWLRAKSSYPCCRERAGKPVYVRALDDLLSCVVEPQLAPEDAQERGRRKRSWQTMQQDMARDARDAVQRFAAVAGGGNAYVPPPHNNTAGAGGGADGALGNASPVRRPPARVAWSVQYARAPRTLCYTCFTVIVPGSVRVVREEAAAGGASTPSREFHHAACRVPGCAPGEVAGVAALRRADCAALLGRMAAAAEAEAAAATQAALASGA